MDILSQLDLKKLSIITSILFLISISMYWQDTRRGTDLVSGSDFIPGFNPEKVERFVFQEKDKEALIFQRQGTTFYLASHNNYPVSIEQMNDFIYKLSNLQILNKASSSKDSHKNYKVIEGDNIYTIKAFDENDKKILHFFVGSKYKNKGSYMRHNDKQDTYLSKEAIFFSSQKDSYINKKLFNFKESKIQKVHIENGNNFDIVRAKNKLSIPTSKKEMDENKLKSFLNTLVGLSFKEFHAQNSPDIVGLNYSHKLNFSTEDTIQYKLQLTEQNKKYFLKIMASAQETPKQVSINKTDDKEQLKKVEDVLKAQKNSQVFNVHHATWVYEIAESVFKELSKGPKDFLKMDAKK